MKRALWLLMLPLAAHAAEHDHSAQATQAPEPAPTEHDHSIHAQPGEPAKPKPPAQADHSTHITEAAPGALVPPKPAPAQADHSTHITEAAPGALVPPKPAPAQADHSTHITEAAPGALVPPKPAPALAEAHEHLITEHGGSLNFLVLGERFEQLEDDGATTRVWEAQGWLGYDRDKLWLKTKGTYDVDDDRTTHSEVQALYSRAVAPFWDLQAGWRRDDAGSATRHYAVLGMQGLAPYWFEVDAAAFISEQGDVSTRLEAEYELRFTQKLLLQPRLELNHSFADDPALGIGAGTSEAAFGLRLRYELRREFAPYVGVEWSRAYGNTAALLRAAGQDREELSIVAGLRFWY